MKNFIQDGNVQTLPVPATGVVSGQPYKVLSVVAIAAASVAYASGATFEGKIRGTFKVTKVGSQAWAVGQAVYWDDANRYFTTTAVNNRRVGWATAVVGSGAGETTGYVYLDGVSRDDEES